MNYNILIPAKAFDDSISYALNCDLVNYKYYRSMGTAITSYGQLAHIQYKNLTTLVLYEFYSYPV